MPSLNEPRSVLVTEAMAGSVMDDVVREAIYLAEEYGLPVMFLFNGRWTEVTADSNYKEVLGDLWLRVTRGDR